jgi:ComF family protein
LPAQLLTGDGQCQGCRDYAPEFERAVAYGEYAGSLRRLIHLLKYEQVTPAAKPLGELLAAAIMSLRSPPSKRVLLVPVPLHSSKRRQRRFNQAELIARAALGHLSADFELGTQVLIRQRATVSQVGLDRDSRIANMHGAFRVADREAVASRLVVVVDDVMTTGTTVSECARVLKQAGAVEVFAATVARVLKAAVTTGFSSQSEGEAAEAALALA